MKKHHYNGFTYIELVIVVGLIGSILAFGMVMNIGSVGRSVVTQERDVFISLLLYGARAKAMANADQMSHGVHIDNTCKRYILFEGTPPYPPLPPDGTCSPKDSREIAFMSNSTYVTIHGGNDIVFDRLSGEVGQGVGTISISAHNATSTIELSSTGRINW